MSQTIEQRRAAFALKKVQDFHGDKDKMSTHVNKTPFRILNNGLGQALAFLQADNEGKTGRDRKESGKLYDWLGEWLCGVDEDARPCRVYPGGSDLMKQMVENDRDHYIRAQEEALALFTWLKKFADAYLQAGQSSQQGGNNAGK